MGVHLRTSSEGGRALLGIPGTAAFWGHLPRPVLSLCFVPGPIRLPTGASDPLTPVQLQTVVRDGR